MKIYRSSQSGLTLVEFSITMGVVGALGLVIYALLNMGTILGAKNAATNTAHQRARIAMIDMIQDLHGAVSLPELEGVVENKASGISFQQWGSVPAANGQMSPNGGPHKIIGDEPVGADHIHIGVTTGQTKPRVGQRVIIPTHQIEETITTRSGGDDDLTLYMENDLTTPINGTDSTAGDIICYITDRVSYDVVADLANPGSSKLRWTNIAGHSRHRERHYQPEAIQHTDYSRGRALLPFRRRDRSLHSRPEVQQARLQVGEYST